MKRYWKRVEKGIVILLIMVCSPMTGYAQEEVQFKMEQEIVQEQEQEATKRIDTYLEEMDLGEIQEALEELLPDLSFHLEDSIRKLIDGEIPISPEAIGQLVKTGMLDELSRQKRFIWQVLLLAISASVFTNYMQVFKREQIVEITFYMIYMLLFLLLIHSFEAMNQLAEMTMGRILQFMKLLLPVYLIAASLATGSVTAAGFYEVVLFFITVVQSIMNYLILPGINFYVLFSLLNYIEKEPILSKLTDLLKWLLCWSIRTLLAVVIGVQTIQSLILPAVDALKRTVWMRGTGGIPMIGNTLSAVTETVLGTCILLKNAVGAGALLVIVLICLIPVARIFICIVLYKMISAVVQPISDARFTESISKAGEGIELLLKAVSATAVMFLITLAMVTVSGGTR